MEKILGQALKKEREARGVSLGDIASETRIGVRFLQALEDEEFNLFPGSFYIHYYIKNYLHACGADVSVFFNTYQPYLENILKTGKETPPDQYLNKMAYSKFRNRKTILWAVFLLGILGLLFYLFLAKFGPIKTYLAGGRSDVFDFPAFSRSLLPLAADYCLAAAPVAARMSFDAPCWLQLWRGSEKILEKTFHPGEIYSLSGYQLTIIIANPPALRLSLNGRDVPYLRRLSTAQKLVINPQNLADIVRR
jgi:hypothetical protein